MAQKKNRPKIPSDASSLVIFKSNLLCCVCKKNGDHIHHLDGNHQNNLPDNLALLCFEHHDRASRIGGLSRKLSKKDIVRFRQHHYQVVEKERKKSLDNISVPIKNITEEDLLTASKNAIIILEIIEN